MRKITSALSLGLFLCAGITANAQITLDSASFHGKMDVERLQPVKLDSVTLPIAGADQEWDWSGVQDTFDVVADSFYDAAHASFPSSSRYTVITNYIGSLPLISHGYYNTTADAHSVIGFSMDYQAFSLESMTTNPDDSLIFPEQDYMAEYPVVKFPATASSNWKTEGYDDVQFNITVTAFGMNKTPGYRREYRTRIDSVIGWGTLIVPSPNGPSKPYDVLLVKTNLHVVDSYFIGGNPAPDMLLQSFNLEQGESFDVESYSYYREGYTNALAMLYTDGAGNITSAYYDPDNTNMVGIFNPERNMVAVTAYPNPVQNGNLQLVFSKSNSAKWSLNITDMTGKVISNETLNQATGEVRASVNVDNAANGVYFYTILNESGAAVANGKFIVNR